MRVEAYNQQAIRSRDSIGGYLLQLDRSIQQWNQLFLDGKATNDARKLKGLYQSIGERTRKLFFEIVEQLESGPIQNRRVAAAALGFVGQEDALSPLLNALTDPDETVCANALLSLAVLGDARTPTGSLAHHLRFGASPRLRNNAALALLEVLRVGGDGGDEVVKAAREALVDDDPGVRTHAALILAHQRDVASIESLALQLGGDSTNSAAMAAGRALAYIGSKELPYQGQCARALAASLSRVEPMVKASVLSDLAKLAGKRYAKDEDWVIWAHRLPPGP